MTSPRPEAALRWRGLLLAAAVCVAPGVALAGGALDLFYERSVMAAADARCDLFDPGVTTALDAARVQARGAALRAGASDETLQAVEQRAVTKARAADCQSADVATAAGRVRTAFEGYSRLSRLTYPGDTADWMADRTISREGPLWRLSQSTRFGWDRMVFGLGGKEGQGVLLASASFADGASPYAIRLVMRDVDRTAGPYLDRRLAGSDGRIPLAGRLPPSATRAFSAEARSPASERLAPGGAKSALLVRFPAAAVEAMARLDPREAVMVEFLFASRDRDAVRKAYVEVGDFAAGRAFLKVAAR